MTCHILSYNRPSHFPAYPVSYRHALHAAKPSIIDGLRSAVSVKGMVLILPLDGKANESIFGNIEYAMTECVGGSIVTSGITSQSVWEVQYCQSKVEHLGALPVVSGVWQLTHREHSQGQ